MLDASHLMVISGVRGTRGDTVMESRFREIHQDRSILAPSVRFRLTLNLVILVARDWSIGATEFIMYCRAL